jgi:hypothetical protein
MKGRLIGGSRRLLRKLYQSLQNWRRRRALRNIRQEFAKAGYPLDRFRDSEIEGAITHWNGDITAFTLSAKIIHRTLNRMRRSGFASEFGSYQEE